MLKILFADVFPLPVQPTEILHHLDYEGYTKLNVEKPYLVVTHTGNGFVELSESELQTCLRSIHFSCRALVALHTAQYPSCLYALYVGDYVTATDLCDYWAFPGLPETQIKDLGESKFLVIAAMD